MVTVRSCENQSVVRLVMAQTASFCALRNYKWKNHFSEMKGDVGMSLHDKEGEQEDA